MAQFLHRRAIEYDNYSDGHYNQEENQARAAKRSLWQDEFVEPAAWCRGERLASERIAAG